MSGTAADGTVEPTGPTVVAAGGAVEPGRRVLGDRYELVALLATGGMGQVWRARDTLLNRQVAVKVLRSEFTGDATFLARFRAEAQHTAVLAHRNIATLYDYGEVPAGTAGPEHLAYLVMELVEGEPLSDLLTREPRPRVPKTLDVLRQTAAALAVAHAAGVVHRDVKPGNVLVGDDGTVKITDFGIAWSASSVPLTQTGQVVGTAHYLSPEQAAGGKATPSSDVYALGLIGYECLAGRRAFDGENSVQIALMQLRDDPEPLPADVPDDVRTLIARALLKDPADRFADGAAFRDAVDDVLAGRPLAPPPTRVFAVPGWHQGVARSRRRLLVPLVALLAGAGIAGGVVQLTGREPVPAVAAEEAGPAPVVLVAEDYVGRPVAEVEAALGALGLQVERLPVETATPDAGLVTAISPAGAVRDGERITVSFAVAPPPPVSPEPSDESAPEQAVVPAPVADSGDADAAAEAGGRAKEKKEKKEKKDTAGGNGRGNGG
jgi:serine/threonine-protein kinase